MEQLRSSFRGSLLRAAGVGYDECRRIFNAMIDKQPAVIVRCVSPGDVLHAVRLQLHALAYNLTNFRRTLALPNVVAHWSLTSLREKLIKIGAKVVRHGRATIFQMAEVAVPRQMFQDILRFVARLRAPPAPA